MSLQHAWLGGRSLRLSRNACPALSASSRAVARVVWIRVRGLVPAGFDKVPCRLHVLVKPARPTASLT